MAKPHGHAERALREILVGSVKQMRERVERDQSMGFAEVELQYQLAVSGTATETPSFSPKTVTFDYPMHYAPGQRDSELANPHFWASGECDGDVLIGAVVRSWTIDPDNGACIGADVSVCAIAESETDFTGFVHLTFQGFGALEQLDTDV